MTHIQKLIDSELSLLQEVNQKVAKEEL